MRVDVLERCSTSVCTSVNELGSAVFSSGTSSLLRASHIILDEVHERNIHTDFVLIILRELLAERWVGEGEGQ